MRKTMLAAAVTAALLAAAIALAATHRFGFDDDAVGAAPAGFVSARTGQGEMGRWVVEAVGDAPSPPNAVRQASTDATSYRFPVLVAEGPRVTDGTLSVSFRAVAGRVDQAGGLVWRYRDENNYYVVRANALEDNVVLYKVENGRRSSLAPKGAPKDTYGVDHEVPAGRWNRLEVRFEGNLFTVRFDGEELFQVEDDTFAGPGRVGLWTKADSVTLFDDLVLEAAR